MNKNKGIIGILNHLGYNIIMMADDGGDRYYTVDVFDPAVDPHKKNSFTGKEVTDFVDNNSGLSYKDRDSNDIARQFSNYIDSMAIPVNINFSLNTKYTLYKIA